MENKIAVLGGRGYIGSYLAKHLRGRVTAVTRDIVDLQDADATYEYLRQEKFDVVIGAAKHPEYPLEPRPDIAITNLALFDAAWRARAHFGTYINLGSGAEFDRRAQISLRREDDLYNYFPVDGYGLSRNIISRVCAKEPNFRTVRLFGVLHHTEPDFKLFKQLISRPEITVRSCYFDYMTLSDVCAIVQYFVDTPAPKYRDVNAVYDQHYLLHEQLQMFKEMHGLETVIHIGEPGLDYSGDGTRVTDLELNLTGLEQGMKDYL